jgi:hypothetical protein
MNDDANENSPTPTAFNGRNGFIIPASMAFALSQHERTWTPGPRVVRELEDGLDAFLEQEAPDIAASMVESRVQSQYEGVFRERERVVLATYFLRDPAAPEPPWGATPSLPMAQFDGCQIEVLHWPRGRKYVIQFADLVVRAHLRRGRHGPTDRS